MSDFAESIPEEEFSRQKRQTKDGKDWAGRNVRIMLLLLYFLAFLCLLRYDEALRIRWSDLILTCVNGNVYRLEVRLPFRKTHQLGGIAPFYLYSNHERPWLCPIRAYAEWVNIMRKLGLEMEGYVFRPRVGFDWFSSDGHQAMVCSHLRHVNPCSETQKSLDRKSTRLNSSHSGESRMPSSA